jgi:oligoendopeptidase F
MAKDRHAVPVDDQWNVSTLYPTFEAWEKEFHHLIPKEAPSWPTLSKYKRTLGSSAKNLKEFLESYFTISRAITKLYTYAHLRHDEDIANDTYKGAYQKILSVFHDFAQDTSWVDPEILAIDDATMAKLLKDAHLKPYAFYIEKIIRVKDHRLPEREEELLAMSAKAMQAPHKAFSALNDADFKFGMVLDSKGGEHELTHGSYAAFIREQDRTLRKNAFEKLHSKFDHYENTMCELLSGEMQAHVFEAKARRYKSCLEAALHPKNIDTNVYYALIKAIRENIQPMHKYVEIRKKILGLDTLHLYDTYVPLVKNVDMKMSYKDAEEVVIESVAPLGPEYQNILRKGLLSERWVDRYENKNKRSGAYSSGCYDSMPYILMNYKGIIKDVFTLAHEAGHSMHSYMSHKNQPYQYGDYPIFLAEVASTFNEELLMHLLLERAKSSEERVFLINEKIEDLRGTFFRQAMFAEFELKLHELAENNVPMTPKLLKAEYEALLKAYFGPALTIDAVGTIEWARIPHFYYNFYVYQYATGISAAMAFADRVLKGGATERDDYLGFLKAGSSRYPIDTLAKAGVDMRSAEPVRATIATFSRLVDQLGKELVSNHKPELLNTCTKSQ